MKFTNESAGTKWNHGMDKASLEDGYEVVPMAGDYWTADRRLGIVNPWMAPIEPGDMELLDD